MHRKRCGLLVNDARGNVITAKSLIAQSINFYFLSCFMRVKLSLFCLSIEVENASVMKKLYVIFYVIKKQIKL